VARPLGELDGISGSAAQELENCRRRLGNSLADIIRENPVNVPYFLPVFSSPYFPYFATGLNSHLWYSGREQSALWTFH
jgi:hypothetical protein